MRFSNLLLTAVFLQLGGCLAGDDSNRDIDIAQDSSVALDDLSIVQMMYDPLYSTPVGFHADARSSTVGSYTIHHLRDDTNSFELCTQDLESALALEAQDAAGRAVVGDYVGYYENDRYFEIVRELSYPDSIGNVTNDVSFGFARVFKCSYVDRSGVDTDALGGYAGQLRASLTSDATLRTLAEYLWQFRFFWPTRAKVLASISSGSDVEYEQSLVVGFLTQLGDHSCDLIEVGNWRFSAAKADGRVRKRYTTLRTIRATLAGGSIRICD